MRISVQNGGLENKPPKVYYKMIKEAGFDGVDWNINNAWTRPDVLENGTKADTVYSKSMEEIMDHWQEQLLAIRENDLFISQAHAPFPAYTLAYNNRHEDFLDFAIEVYKKCILLCQEVGCPCLVIHGISRRGLEHPTIEEIDGLNDKLYESLIPTLMGTDVTVCLENLFGSSQRYTRCGHCSDPYRAAAFIDKLNAGCADEEHFGLCLDVGHLMLTSGDFTEYIGRLGSRIKCLHLHDNDGQNDSHMAPYTGVLPWEELLAALKSVNYSGDLSFETFRQVSVVPEALVPEFLRHIAAIGHYFRSELLK